MKLKKLILTDALHARIDACQRAAATHVPGRDPSTDVELPALQLASTVLVELARQQLPVRASRVARASLPRRKRAAS